MTVTLDIHSDLGPRDRLFRYFWIKRVEGFSPGVHCARCLRGDYLVGDGKGLAVPQSGLTIDLAVEEGSVLYVCGVDIANRYDRNLHLAARVDPQEVACAFRDEVGVMLNGAREIPFSDRPARRLFPDRGEEFLSCRNFHFGAQHFGSGD